MREFCHESVISLYNTLMQSSKRIVAGIDEAGRGPLAGPVMAAAVVFLPNRSLSKNFLAKVKFCGIKDSKKLSLKQREEYYRIFLKHPEIRWGIGKVSEKKIDRINIYQATKLAMLRAVSALQRKLPSTKFNHLVIDGNFTIDSPLPQKPVIKADETVLVCTIASIVAKVTRDRLMFRYHKTYPGYGFNRHKGYGTAFHLAKLKLLGPCEYHRKTFSPVASLIKLKKT